MYSLIVMIIVAGNLMGPVFYNKATWPTKEACETFVKSDAGVASLKKLTAAVEQATGATEKDVLLQPACEKTDADSQQ